MSVSVRDIKEQDQSRWFELWEGYLTFYQAEVPTEVSEATWQRVLNPDRDGMYHMVKVINGSLSVFISTLWVSEALLYN